MELFNFVCLGCLRMPFGLCLCGLAFAGGLGVVDIYLAGCFSLVVWGVCC